MFPFERFVGLDPGVGSPFTTSISATLHCNVQENETITFSGKEYRHLAKHKAQRDWFNRIKNSNPHYNQLISEMPSMKTSVMEVMKEALVYRLKHFDWLFTLQLQNHF